MDMSFSTTGFLQETLSSKHVDKIFRLFLSRKNEVKDTKVKVVADSFAWSRPNIGKNNRGVCGIYGKCASNARYITARINFNRLH